MNIIEYKKSSEINTDRMIEIIKLYLEKTMNDEKCENKYGLLSAGIKQIIQIKFHKTIMNELMIDNLKSHTETAILILNKSIDEELNSILDCHRKYKTSEITKQQLIEYVGDAINKIIDIKLAIFRLDKLTA